MRRRAEATPCASCGCVAVRFMLRATILHRPPHPRRARVGRIHHLPIRAIAPIHTTIVLVVRLRTVVISVLAVVRRGRVRRRRRRGRREEVQVFGGGVEQRGDAVLPLVARVRGGDVACACTRAVRGRGPSGGAGRVALAARAPCVRRRGGGGGRSVSRRRRRRRPPRASPPQDAVRGIVHPVYDLPRQGVARGGVEEGARTGVARGEEDAEEGLGLVRGEVRGLGASGSKKRRPPPPPA